MVKLQSFTAVSPKTDEALANLGSALDLVHLTPNLVCVFYDCVHEDDVIFDFIHNRFPDSALLGGTSCNGVMSEAGLPGPGSIGILLIEDADGDYGSAGVTLDVNVADCAERTLHAALDDAGCKGELPELIWIYQTPGQEEAVIEGLRRVVGDRCPIIGGSAADNTVEGQWRQMGPDGPLHDGLVVGVLFSSGGIGFAFQGGYEPNGPTGIVTRVGPDASSDSRVATNAGSRQILAIDDEPAAVVYNRWLGGSLSNKLGSGGAKILLDTTMYPLGLDAGKIEGVTHYRLVHPEGILEHDALSTFASVEEGTRLYSMRGDKTRLVERAGKVAATAAATLDGGISNLAGGLIVYCAGCMLAVGDQMPLVSQEVSASFNGMPFIGCFTYGEQGSLLETNTHGNLMISAISFGK